MKHRAGNRNLCTTLSRIARAEKLEAEASEKGVRGRDCGNASKSMDQLKRLRSARSPALMWARYFRLNSALLSIDSRIATAELFYHSRAREG